MTVKALHAKGPGIVGPARRCAGPSRRRRSRSRPRVRPGPRHSGRLSAGSGQRVRRKSAVGSSWGGRGLKDPGAGCPLRVIRHDRAIHDPANCREQQGKGEIGEIGAAALFQPPSAARTASQTPARGPCRRGKLETCGAIGRFARIACFDQTLSAVSVRSLFLYRTAAIVTSVFAKASAPSNQAAMPRAGLPSTGSAANRRPA